VKLLLIFLLCAYSSADMHASQTALSTTFGNHKVSLGMSVDDSLRALVQDFDVVLQSGDTVSGTTIWDVWQKSPRVLVGAISIKDRLVVQIDRQWVEETGMPLLPYSTLSTQEQEYSKPKVTPFVF